MPTDSGEAPVAGNLNWVPRGIDTTVPNPGRMYDYWLDGGHNFPADRDLANKVQQVVPGARDGARVNRAFLRRAVVFMVESGIRQFLDIILARYRDQLASGSYLALSHVTADGNFTGLTEGLQLYQNILQPVHLRDYQEVLRLFAGFDLVEPGLVSCAFWQSSGPGDTSDSAEMNALLYGGVGRKP